MTVTYDKQLRDKRRSTLEPHKSGSKMCKECGKKKPTLNFSLNMAYSDGLENRCKECSNLKAREYRRMNAASAIWSSRKYWAAKNGVPFSISVEDVVIPDTCPILGLRLKMNEKAASDASPTLDKIDPTRGYVKGNVAVISHRANRLKSDMTVVELEAILSYMKKEGPDATETDQMA